MQPQVGLTTSNRYASLGNVENQPSSSVREVKPVKQKIPPIVTTEMNINAIRQLMDTIKIDNSRFFIRFMSIGTKIILQNRADFDSTVAELLKQKKPFFTHDIPSDKTSKYVLSGLHDVPPADIKIALSNAGVSCLDVKKMRTRNDNHCLFLVYFLQKSVTLNQLKTIKSILNIIIKWSPYISAQKGPTQCNNCQQYGHGNRNCHLIPSCLLCAGQHNKVNCPAAKMINFVPKCSLCSGNHNSNDPDCPKRAEYIHIRQSTSSRYKTQTTLPSANQRPTNRCLTSNPIQPSTPLPNLVAPLSHVTPSSSGANKKTSYASILTGPATASVNEELFTAEELIELTMVLINKLSKCRSKSEQFQVVSQLAFTFVYPKNGP